MNEAKRWYRLNTDEINDSGASIARPGSEVTIHLAALQKWGNELDDILMENCPSLKGTNLTEFQVYPAIYRNSPRQLDIVQKRVALWNASGLAHRQSSWSTSRVYYAYALLECRPESPGTLSPSNVFYIGKGKGSRALAHVYDAHCYVTNETKGSNMEKIERICSIWSRGGGVVAIKYASGIAEEEALRWESIGIDYLRGRLTNLKAGEFFVMTEAEQRRQEQLLLNKLDRAIENWKRAVAVTPTTRMDTIWLQDSDYQLLEDCVNYLRKNKS